MNTWHYLSDEKLAALFVPGILTGLAMAVMCSCLSVLVVLKRLSFIGQGISHAAFGGMGIAAILGLTGAGAAAFGQFTVVAGFCLLAALLVAWLSARGSTSSDTAIGIVLVASMCLGGILLHIVIQSRGSGGPGWESMLFGSINGVLPVEAGLAGLVAAVVVFAAWWWRRPLLFWAFDEPSAPAFGVSSFAMRHILLVLLCLAIVTAMKVSGVVLATAMLVLPAATALCLSDRLWVVVGLSELAGVLGVVGGILLSMEMNWPPGPCIVAVLTAVFCVARCYEEAVRADARSDARGEVSADETQGAPAARERNSSRSYDMNVKAETLLAELNRLRKDLDEDPSDLEWVTLHHAFCFISYKMGEFQKYVEEQAKQGAFEELG